MPISNGEQPTVPGSESIPAPDGPGTENDAIEQIRTQVEKAERRLLENAVKEGPSSEIAIEAVVAYHTLLTLLSEKAYPAHPADTADPKIDRESWLCTEIYNTFVAASKINPDYQEMADSSWDDLQKVQL